MLDIASLPPASLDRMVRAVEKVRERLLKATAALEAANIPYAVVGGNAVAAWVSRVDEAAVRNTQDVDILIRRDDLPAVTTVLESIGFVYRHVRFVDMFLDGPGAKARDAIHVVFANEKVKQEYLSETADVTESVYSLNHQYKHLDLESLVRMKLTSYRDKDRTHLRDLIDVELIDESWPAKFPGELGQRLQAILDNPEG